MTVPDLHPGANQPELSEAATVLSGAGGIRLVADLGGPADGPSVALFHGGGQTRFSWTGTWSYLTQRGWRAMSLDLRGHGDSEWVPDGDYTIDAFADDIVEVTAELPRPPVLVGASLGGIASLLAVGEADDQRAVASGLVLVDIAHRMEEKGRDRVGDFLLNHLDGFASLEEAADAIAAYNPHRPRPTDLSGLAKNLRRRDDRRWYWHWDPRFVSGRFGSSDETRTSQLRPQRLVEAASALSVPVLLVRGRQSDLLSQEGADEFLELVPHAEFADVSGAGHMVAGDRNEVFNEAVLEFLARHSDQPRRPVPDVNTGD